MIDHCKDAVAPRGVKRRLRRVVVVQRLRQQITVACVDAFAHFLLQNFVVFQGDGGGPCVVSMKYFLVDGMELVDAAALEAVVVLGVGDVLVGCGHVVAGCRE